MAANKIHFRSVVRARCPSCHFGLIRKGILSFHPRCSRCQYNFNPENGFFLGAMMLSFLLTAMLTIPPMILMKFFGVQIEIILAFPFVQFLFLGPILLFYARVFWLHLEYRLTDRLDGHP